MSNYAHVGKVTMPVARWESKGVEAVEVAVGVRADTGEVVVQTDGKNGAPLPRLTPDAAAQLAVLLDKGAGMASELVVAYQAYQRALQDAEDKLAAVMGLPGGAR